MTHYRADRVPQEVQQHRHSETNTDTLGETKEGACQCCTSYGEPFVPDHRVACLPESIDDQLQADEEHERGCQYGRYIGQDVRRCEEEAGTDECNDNSLLPLTSGRIKDTRVRVNLTRSDQLFRPLETTYHNSG
jgi:hypothetical protein